MKFFVQSLMLLFSLHSFAADGDKCLSHGQCQYNSPTETPACFKVLTGIDNQGQVTCRIQCVNILATAYCHKTHVRSVVGKCRSEVFPMPILNPDDPKACKGAVSLEVLDIR